MALKKDICPLCKEYLIYNTERMKHECPTPTCPFVDRRKGSTTMDPSKDRRTNEHDAWKVVGYRK